MSKKKWINNGKIQTYINENGPLPEGFSYGMLTSSTKGFMWYNNGKESLYLPPNEIPPDGFVKCSLHRSNKGHHWFTDGKITSNIIKKEICK